MNICNSFNHLLVFIVVVVCADGNLPHHVELRCQELLSRAKLRQQGALAVCSSSFTLNRPPRLTNDGYVRSEASAMAAWLKKKGYTGKIVCEQQSHDTVGSIFFVYALMATFFSLKNIEFISSEFHSERVRYISSFVNKIAFSNSFELSYKFVPDSDFNDQRMIHEASSLEAFKSNFGLCRDRAEFAEKFFFHHSNYNQHFSSDVFVNDDLFY